jgi:predicted amidohydrolase
MRWLPARAWENGVYAEFSNAVGVDDDTIKPGLAMILDPFGEVVAESRVSGLQPFRAGPFSVRRRA